MPDHFLSTLSLSEEQRKQPPKTLTRLRTVHEWVSSAVDAMKDNKDFPGMLNNIRPRLFSARTCAKQI